MVEGNPAMIMIMIMTIRDEGLALGLDLFNRGHFFEAHEVLEDIWRALPRDLPSRRLRLHLQGLIQLAVAFHHHSTGNLVGARSVLARALRNLRGAEQSFTDLDFERLRGELVEWERHLAGDGARPRAPHLFGISAPL